MAKKRRKQLSEEKILSLVLKDHPQWRRDYLEGTLPEEIEGEDGEPMSPQLHIAMHTIVEQQLAIDEPAGIVAIAEELEQLGVARHEIRHQIASVLVEQVWAMQHEGREFDEVQYFADLREIVDEYR